MFLSKRKRASKKIDIRTTSGFSYLYHAYLDYVYYICFTYTNDDIASEEIASKLFTTIWERREELYEQTWEDDSWKRYLNKAAKNSVYTFLRNKKRAEVHASEASKELYQQENTTEKEVFFEELAEQVSYYTEQLPPRCREVFHLSRDQGLTNKQIAARLFISDHAVKKHIAKALKFLREHLKEYEVPKKAAGG